MDVAPSYTAVAELQHATWVILTNGISWRLYTNKVSASTTNYFEVKINARYPESLRYLVALFGAAVHTGKHPPIDKFFEQARLKAESLEEDLRSKILKADGLFLDIVKGMLDHDMMKKFEMDDLERSKKSALAVMYRVWFILYAESRKLLPVDDPQYMKISFRSLRARLDGYGNDPNGHDCWEYMLRLFNGIRDGSPEHNLPKYNGGLFASRPDIDLAMAQNRFIVPAMRSLLEIDGQAIDYGDLGVRHLGSIYEALLEFEVRQADRDILLLEDKGGVREVESKVESTYSYKKNDLYFASRGGIVSRKATASFYTPDKIVSFLVGRGLVPLLEKRGKLVGSDVRRYRKYPTENNKKICMDRLLDIQVLDPAMGSGHFLVEALNQITQWATEVLNMHPDHPLVAEIDLDRQIVLDAQKKNGVIIDESLLTADVLLKRRVMKRCIFGVDLNDLAVELARLSLWLDSFAIGVPLTYLDHHIKQGDSTIGEWIRNVDVPQDHSLDEWFDNPLERGTLLARVSDRPDITVDQVNNSRKDHEDYKNQTYIHRIVLDTLVASTIDETIIPKTRKGGYIHRLANSSDVDAALNNIKKQVRTLSNEHHFFHWELEMVDAFTDSRSGFDLVVGNPPWEKSKPYDDEFFTQYDPLFRSLKPKTKKIIRSKELLKDPEIKASYEKYINSFKNKAAFYKTFQLQGQGDKDLWQLMLERMLNLVADDGVITIVVPSQIFANVGATTMRKRLLDMNILQAYVFENKMGIFPIHRQWRFVVLTVQKRHGPDKFPAAFYLHHLSSLENLDIERAKFTTCSKRTIKCISPDDLVIPEVKADAYALFEKLSVCRTMGTWFKDGWKVELAAGFHIANDASFFREDGKGWPVLKGKNIHQFNHTFSKPHFTVNLLDAFKHLGRKNVYNGHCKDYHDQYLVVFRDTTGPKNMRTVIAAIVPPRKFHVGSLRSIILSRNHGVEFSDTYNQKIAYITGVLNSMTFDFIARSKTQIALAPIIKNLFVPHPSVFDNRIATTAGWLSSWGATKDEFVGLAESLGLVREDPPPTPSARIDATGKLDALVAHAYGLTRREYLMVLNSFKFNEDPLLHNNDSVPVWSDNKVLRCFYGEVRKAAVRHFDAIAKDLKLGVDGNE